MVLTGLLSTARAVGTSLYGRPGSSVSHRPYDLEAETAPWKEELKEVTDGPDARDWQVRRAYRRELAETGVLDLPKAASLWANNAVTVRAEGVTGTAAEAATTNPIAALAIKYLYSEESPLANAVAGLTSLTGLKLASDGIEAVNNVLRVGPPTLTARQSHENLQSTAGADLAAMDAITARHHSLSRRVLGWRRGESVATLTHRLLTITAPFLLASGLHDHYLASYMLGVASLLCAYGSALVSVGSTTDAALIENDFRNEVAYNLKPPLIAAHLAHKRFAHELALTTDVPELYELKILIESLHRHVSLAEGVVPVGHKGLKERIKGIFKRGDEARHRQELVDFLKAELGNLEALELAYTRGEISVADFVERYAAARQRLREDLPRVANRWCWRKIERFLDSYPYLITCDLIRRLELLLNPAACRRNEEISKVSDGCRERIKLAIGAIKAERKNGLDTENVLTVLRRLEESMAEQRESEAAVSYVAQVSWDYDRARKIHSRLADPEMATRRRAQFKYELQTMQTRARKARADLMPRVMAIVAVHTGNTFLAGAMRLVGGGKKETEGRTEVGDELAAIAEIRREFYDDAAVILDRMACLARLAQNPPEGAGEVVIVTDRGDREIRFEFDQALAETHKPKIRARLDAMRHARHVSPSAITSVASVREAENMVKFATVSAFAVGAAIAFVGSDMGVDFVRGLIGEEPLDPNHNNLVLVVQGRLRGGYVFPFLLWVPLAATSLLCSAKGFVNNHFASVGGFSGAWRRVRQRRAKVTVDLTAMGGVLFTTDSMFKPVGDAVLAGVRLANSYFLAGEKK